MDQTLDRIVLTRPHATTNGPEPDTLDPGPMRRRAPSLAKPLVVLVDGIEAHADSLTALLGRHYRIKCYGSGEQAWASLQVDCEADVAIVSQSLPRMSGLELVARLRKARLPSLRTLPVVLMADSLDDRFRTRVAREPVDCVSAWDRPLVDVGAWLRDRIAGVPSQAPRPSRTDALRRWAHQHGALDERMRESLVVLRIASDGVGVLGERLARAIRRPEMMLAESLNCVWLCIDVPISSAPKFAVRLALSTLPGVDRDRARLMISYAPLLQLADETYDVLQTLADGEPPPGHLQVATHHWRFALPFDAARLLVR